MKFPSGIVATCNTTYGAPMSGFYRVHGSKGVLSMEPAFGYEGIHLTARFNSGGKMTTIDVPDTSHDPSQFKAEADHFTECILENKTPKSPGEEGLRDMELIEKIYASCGSQT